MEELYISNVFELNPIWKGVVFSTAVDQDWDNWFGYIFGWKKKVWPKCVSFSLVLIWGRKKNHVHLIAVDCAAKTFIVDFFSEAVWVSSLKLSMIDNFLWAAPFHSCFGDRGPISSHRGDICLKPPIVLCWQGNFLSDKFRLCVVARYMHNIMHKILFVTATCIEEK